MATRYPLVLNGTSIQELQAGDTIGVVQGAIVTDNDLSFDMTVGNNFTCTLGAGATLTFTNITAGQSGCVYLNNSGGYAVAKAASIKAAAAFTATVSAAGIYLLSYYAPDASTVIVTSSQAVS